MNLLAVSSRFHIPSASTESVCSVVTWSLRANGRIQNVRFGFQDFRNYQYTLPIVKGLVVDMEVRKTTIKIPSNRYNEVRSSCSFSLRLSDVFVSFPRLLGSFLCRCHQQQIFRVQCSFWV